MQRWIIAFVTVWMALVQAQGIDVQWDSLSYQANLQQPVMFEPAARYHIWFEIRSFDDVHGYQDIFFTNQTDERLTEIVFHLHPNALDALLEVTAVQLGGVAAPWRLEDDGYNLHISLQTPLNPGEQLMMRLDFRVTIPFKQITNLGRLAVYDEVTSYAHIYPILARYIDGQWDTRVPIGLLDPVDSDSAFYHVTITTPAAYQLVATGEQLSVLEQPGQMSYRYAALARDFYFTLSPSYQVLERDIEGARITSSAPERFAEASHEALEIAAQALSFFSDLLGEYPLKELDIVAVPVDAGGVEYPGIINVASNFYRPGDQFFEVIVVHEVAHQWFYNIIGSDPLAEPWLDESLTQYVTWRFYESQGRGEWFRRYLANNWSDASRRDLSIAMNSLAYSEADYGAIIYGKGAFFFEALADTLGREAFDQLLKDYVHHFQWQHVSASDFRRFATQWCACDLSLLYSDWLE